MIDSALKALADDLNAAFRRQRNDSRERVVVSNFVTQQGNPVGEGGDKIYLLLTQIAEEKNVASNAPMNRSPSAQAQVTAPINLNLHVMFAAVYSRYEVGLQVISEVIAYLQSKPVFTPANTPGMNPMLEKIILTLLKLSYAEQSYLWGCLGAKYTPSVVYSLRMLTFGGGQVAALPPSVTQPNVAGPLVADGLLNP